MDKIKGSRISWAKGPDTVILTKMTSPGSFIKSVEGRRYTTSYQSRKTNRELAKCPKCGSQGKVSYPRNLMEFDAYKVRCPKCKGVWSVEPSYRGEIGSEYWVPESKYTQVLKK